MFDPMLTEWDILSKYSVFLVIPVFWVLVRFLSGVLPGGKKP
ncbi:MAG: hypothetical protein C0P72_010085 [Clostridia bacterium]